MSPTFAPTSLDHVALWVDDRGPLATFLCDHLGMHVIEETDTFTLVGIDAKLGKLTLFDAEGPRQRGALERVVLRVADLERVLTALPFDTMRQGDGVAAFEAPAGVPLGLVEADGAEFDLDHVALWVDDREPLAKFLCDYLGMHVIEETDTFTLVGIDAKLGKLTLFDAEGPRQRGALERVVLRVGELERVLTALPFDTMRQGDGVAAFEAPAGVPLGLVEADGAEFDLDHVVLGLSDPDAAARELAALGFEPREDGCVAVGDRHVRIVRGNAADGGRPLLNHLALLVENARGIQDEAEGAGIEIDEVKDAKNTFAVFVSGPEGVRVEYVEHKPGFALV